MKHSKYYPMDIDLLSSVSDELSNRLAGLKSELETVKNTRQSKQRLLSSKMQLYEANKEELERGGRDLARHKVDELAAIVEQKQKAIHAIQKDIEDAKQEYDRINSQKLDFKQHFDLEIIRMVEELRNFYAISDESTLAEQIKVLESITSDKTLFEDLARIVE